MHKFSLKRATTFIHKESFLRKTKLISLKKKSVAIHSRQAEVQFYLIKYGGTIPSYYT